MPYARHLACAALVALATVASAQQIYRIVGPDGRITFSDKPPAEPSAKAAPANVVPLPGQAGPAASSTTLPFELRQVSGRYPVTLYTGPDCGPCETGRAYLSGRGIPYSEKSVRTTQDVEALQRLSGSPSLPFLTIGGQQLKGYSEVEWGQFLDAAGYPKSSLLPSSYRQPAATPLVQAQEPPNPAAAAPRPVPQPRPAQAAPETPAPAPSNPAGIQF